MSTQKSTSLYSEIEIQEEINSINELIETPSEEELEFQEFQALKDQGEWTTLEFEEWVDNLMWAKPTLWMSDYLEWLSHFEPLWASVTRYKKGGEFELNQLLTGSYGPIQQTHLEWIGADVPNFDWVAPIKTGSIVYEYSDALEAYVTLAEPQIKMTKSVKKAWEDASVDNRLWVYALQLSDPNQQVKLLKETKVPFPKGTSCHYIVTIAHWVGIERFINLLVKPQTRMSVEEVNGEMVRKEVPVEGWFVKDIVKTVEIYEQALSDWLRGKLPGVAVEELTPKLGRIRSLQQLHNELTPQAVAVQREVELDQFELAEFDGFEWEGYTFVIPKSSREIALWGKKHHHCVGTYTYRIKSGQAKVFGLFHEEELIYTGSIVPYQDDWRLEQLMGPHNAPAPEELQEKLIKLMELIPYS
jgi:hypothetical protein